MHEASHVQVMKLPKIIELNGKTMGATSKASCFAQGPYDPMQLLNQQIHVQKGCIIWADKQTQI